jgi:hypothetical protein
MSATSRPSWWTGATMDGGSISIALPSILHRAASRLIPDCRLRRRCSQSAGSAAGGFVGCRYRCQCTEESACQRRGSRRWLREDATGDSAGEGATGGGGGIDWGEGSRRSKVKSLESNPSTLDSRLRTAGHPLRSTRRAPAAYPRALPLAGEAPGHAADGSAPG